ncbi:hypothetical protein BJP34_20690 [Moorena producens PAL-8-15-08-1]|uniref:Uncharacterized protein n=1 Tax=Moorena producens PAL-8-15-08-1 TaxID=1458985 RepID=A0A1D8TV69_9CYAN|nr:hypothetical protein BJP34_20690 [Moorena producens PAL-8-15-08-1]
MGSGKNPEIGKVSEELISHCPPEAEVFFYSICKPCFRCDRSLLQDASDSSCLTQWVEWESNVEQASCLFPNAMKQASNVEWASNVEPASCRFPNAMERASNVEPASCRLQFSENQD